MASLLLSQGVPMLLAGDECRRTQAGNNNPYCLDNEVTWFNWKLVEKHQCLERFCAALVAFRRAEPTVRQNDFLLGQPAAPGDLPDVSWFTPSGGQVDWSGDSRSLVCLLAAARAEDRRTPNHHVLMLFHAGADARHFSLPSLARGIAWDLFVDTAAESPADIYPALDGPPPPANGIITLQARSLVVYVGRDGRVS